MNITTSKRAVATATERAASFQAFRSQVLYPLGMHALMLLGVFIIVFPSLYARSRPSLQNLFLPLNSVLPL